MENAGKKVAVLGGGSWATAIIKMLSDNAQPKDIFWWMRSQEAADHIRRYGRNPSYLSSLKINIPGQNISNNIQDIIEQAEYIILSIPAAFLQSALEQLPAFAFKGKKIISAIKGIVPDESLIIGEFLNRRYHVPFDDILVISGPCHAEEVALEKLSYLTIACTDAVAAARFADMISTRYIKTTVSDDIFGTEYAAVLKNIYAVASGICHGLGYGDNFQAVLISNAIREMKRFVDKIHPIDRDIMESAYLGDLLVTAYSQFSRNRTFGNMIGKGYTVKSAQLEMNMIAEGYYAVNSINEINKQYGVHLPICKAVYTILYERRAPRTEIELLLTELS